MKVNAPPDALTPEVRAAIAHRKPELLDLLTSEAALANGQAGPVTSVPRTGKLALSLFQERLWVVEQLHSENEPSYNMVSLWEIAGSDPDLLTTAIANVVRRHEILRSTVLSDDIAPFVHLLPVDAVPVPVHDLRARSPEAQRQVVKAETQAAIRERFDLSREPPVRWLVYVLEDGRSLVRLCAHHIALDEWSFSVLHRELQASLSATRLGVTLPPPALQYLDYAAWERNRLTSPAIAAQLSWWERRLAGSPAFCAIPPDRRSDAPVGAVHVFAWDEAFTADLRALAHAHRATLYMVLLAGFSAVLHAYTGLGDLVIGSPLGVRSRPEFETMLGPFVNLAVLRVAVDDDPTFAVLIDRARTAVLDAHDHSNVPLEMLIERLKPIRSFEHPPLFQVALVLHNASEAPRSEIFGGGIDHHITWYAREQEGTLSMSLQYRADLYNADTIERVAGHLGSLLAEAVRNPLRPLSTMPVLGGAERALVLQDFNATHVALDPAPLSIQFQRQVRLTPNAIAIRCQGTATSYDALNRRANQIARHLRSRGAGAGMLIGLCLNRTAAMPACLLAVLKTGAAYVPLDPSFPAARLDLMIEDSGIGLLVVQDETIPVGPTTIPLVNLTHEAGAIDGLDDGNLEIVPAGDDPAYVIYTSGSTGRPNGVVVPSAALTNFIGAMRRDLELSDRDVLAAVTTISFDIAGLELYLPLIIGACVVLVGRDVATDGFALAGLLADEGITVMQATPATWRLLVEAGWNGGSAFKALCGGEALPPDLADDLASRVGSLWNLYGPTETTIWSTAGRITPNSDQITVGRPIANTSVYIVDPAGEPVPIGVPGEIWIGGSGVALGYHRNPLLTSKRLSDDPFAGPGRGRVYRTGDLGRWLPDGRIVHMGRLDQQLKLRGFRIEPAEIEAALTSHAAVRQAVVVLLGASAATQRLVAYVVFGPDAELTSSEARSFLRRSLPDYMIPSLFIPMEHLPLTPNGKIDRSALPTPFRAAAASSATYVPPAPGAEQLLAGLWGELLKVDSVGANDNFFDLGGYSLLALRLANAVYQRTGCRIQLRDLFTKTLSQLAATLQPQ